MVNTCRRANGDATQLNAVCSWNPRRQRHCICLLLLFSASYSLILRGIWPSRDSFASFLKCRTWLSWLLRRRACPRGLSVMTALPGLINLMGLISGASSQHSAHSNVGKTQMPSGHCSTHTLHWFSFFSHSTYLSSVLVCHSCNMRSRNS